uniref:Uncharacterized protein n=1 Tax=Arundo donax TaxID=35708 RepID=A0A0A8YQS5_ARUDO
MKSTSIALGQHCFLPCFSPSPRRQPPRRACLLESTAGCKAANSRKFSFVQIWITS